MSIVVGYRDTPEGRTALEAATAESAQRGLRLVVVVSERADGTDDERRSALESSLDHVERVDRRLRLGAG